MAPGTACPDRRIEPLLHAVARQQLATRHVLVARGIPPPSASFAIFASRSVSAAALRWGFAHLGRFSAEYRRAFGECPAQTLRRRGAGYVMLATSKAVAIAQLVAQL